MLTDRKYASVRDAQRKAENYMKERVVTVHRWFHALAVERCHINCIRKKQWVLIRRLPLWFPPGKVGGEPLAT